jgi:uncharacterized membrane protein
MGSGISQSFIQKAGLAVLWGGIGFILIYQGLRHKLIQVRLAALALFLLTLIKLFAYDIWMISPLGRIMAFISLGVLLLVISFMYNRLRNIILKGDIAAEAETKDRMDDTSAGPEGE